MKSLEHESRLPFFPVPAPGETVYSVTGRFIQRSGLSQGAFDSMIIPKKKGQNLFKTELTTYIDRLPPIMPPGHPWIDCRQIIRNHSILPYYTYFDSLERSLEIESRFTEFAKADTAKRRRVSWFTNTCRFPRYCPACAHEDHKQRGYSYFRREHQLPGVVVCWQHGDILNHGCKLCGAYQFKDRAFKMPGTCSCASGITPLPSSNFTSQMFEDLLWLAKQSAFVVSSTRPRISNFFSGLRLATIKRGYTAATRETAIAIARSIENRFGRDVLQYLGIRTCDANEPAQWIKRFLLRNPAIDTKRNTLPYLLMVGSLFHNLRDFEHDALNMMETEEDYFLNQGEAIRVGVNEEKVCSHRSILLEYIRINPEATESELKSEIAYSYNYLIANDPDWPPLKNIKRTPRSKGRKIIRMCIPQLDSEKAVELERFFDEMYARSGRPVRITRRMATRTVGLRYHDNNHAEYLVTVNEVINRRLETDDEFLKRTICWAVSEIMSKESACTIAAIVSKARIPSELLPKYETYIREHVEKLGHLLGINDRSASARQLQLF